MTRDAYVLGRGMIDFGEHYDRSFDHLLEDAYLELLDDVDVGPADIDGAWYGTLDVANEGLSGAAAAHATGLFETPVTRVENACATGSDAFRQATQAVQAGAADCALVIGAEKMRDTAEGLISIAAEKRVWRGRGVTMPAFFGMRATRHMEAYGTTREQIAEVSVKNHENGAKYPHAHYKFECSVEDVLNSTQISYPLNLYDCCPVTDGAAAVLVGTEELARVHAPELVRVAGSGLAADSFQRADDTALTNFPATRHAADQAYEQSGYGPEDVDVAEVHDCFSITELVTYEDLGFCGEGEGGDLVESGATRLDGDIPVNPSGGLLAKGHPIGATGVAQIAEIYEQLVGAAGEVQVDAPEVGLQHNIGIGRNSTGSVSCVTLLERV